jgi:hypothetical protein
MQITSYQMHNVLNCYSRQLSQNRRSARFSAAGRLGGSDKPPAESGGKREATLEAVSNDIYQKLTDPTSLEVAGEPPARSADETQTEETFRDKPNQPSAQFTFNVIDQMNRKITNRLSAEDSSGFIERLEKLEKEAVDKKIESWI